MIKPDMIPPYAMYAAWKAMNAGMTLNDALAAALNAWPDAISAKSVKDLFPNCLVLPLPQKDNIKDVGDA